jgi:hypothetical protein
MNVITVTATVVSFTHSNPNSRRLLCNCKHYEVLSTLHPGPAESLPDPSVVVTSPTSGSVPTQIQILSPTATAAQFNVQYSDGTTIQSNFAVNFLHEGSFPNGSGVRLTIALVPIFTKPFVPSTILLNGTST